MQKYYKLDQNTTGKILSSYSRPQPHIEGLVYLEEPDDERKTVWDGSSWQYDLDLYKKQIWKELYAMMKDNLFELIINKREGGDPTFDIDDALLKAQIFRSDNAGLTTISEIDSARQQAINWMGLE